MKHVRIITILAASLAVIAASLWAQTPTVWHNPLASAAGGEPYVCGRAWNAETGANFHRLPARCNGVVPEGVWNLSLHSAGLSLRFSTNSSVIRVGYRLAAGWPHYFNMTWMDSSGADLYGKDARGRMRWIGNSANVKIEGDSATITYSGIRYPRGLEGGTEFRLYLPAYNEVRSLNIGVESGARFAFLHEERQRPLVVYGTSIVHGSSPSRPGLMFTNIVGRELDIPVVNLGFSGKAFLEPEMFNLIAEVDAAAFVIDPVANSFRVKDEMVERTCYGVRRLRSASAAPILMVESRVPTDSLFRPAYAHRYTDANRLFREAYDKLRAEGVKGLYYLSAADLGLTEESLIEGSHPNDLGNIEYARAYIKALKKALKSARK